MAEPGRPMPARGFYEKFLPVDKSSQQDFLIGLTLKDDGIDLKRTTCDPLRCSVIGPSRMDLRHYIDDGERASVSLPGSLTGLFNLCYKLRPCPSTDLSAADCVCSASFISTRNFAFLVEFKEAEKHNPAPLERSTTESANPSVRGEFLDDLTIGANQNSSVF